MDTSLVRLLSKAYCIDKELGSGGFGTVFLAVHLLTEQKVAIKVIDKSKHNQELLRIYREIRALKKLHHPYICKLYQVIENDGYICMVLEYCSSGELFDFIVEQSCVDEDEAKRIISQMVAAIAFIHNKGYSHRDLKPENIMLDEENNVKVIDFGLCAKPKGCMETKLDTACGSATYAAPEILENVEYFGRDIDVWSLGVILYVLAIGLIPFEGQSGDEVYDSIKNKGYRVPDSISISLKALLYRMLEVDPKKRISISEIIEHPWFDSDRALKRKMKDMSRFKSNVMCFDAENLDQDVVKKLSSFFCTLPSKIAEEIAKANYDYLTATYLLLVEQKQNGNELHLSQKFIFNKVFQQTKKNMEVLLQEQKEGNLFKAPKKSRVKQASLTPDKNRKLPPMSPNSKFNGIGSTSLSPSSKIIRSIGRLFVGQSPFKNMFKDKSEELNVDRVKRRLDYSSKNADEPKEHRRKQDKSMNIVKIPPHIKSAVLMSCLEETVNELKLVYMRTENLVLVEKLTQATLFSQLALGKGSNAQFESGSSQTEYTASSMTTLKICLSISKLSHYNKDGKQVVQLGIRRKRITGESWTYKSVSNQIFKLLNEKLAKHATI